jgi:hypothetical protein
VRFRRLGAGRHAPFLIAALALSGCLQEPPPAGPLVHGNIAAARLDPAAARDALNAYRASRGLGAVRLDPALSAMAQRQAGAMAAAGEISHELDGAFAARIERAGLDTARAGENIAAGFFSQGAAFDEWKRSPGHNANLLMPQATRFGIGMAKAPATRYQVYWAMEIAADPPLREGPPVAPATAQPIAVSPAALLHPETLR